MMRKPIAAILVCLMLTSMTTAQVAPASSGQKSLAATLNVYVFPTQGQSPSQQSEDQASCYSWAVQNTGVDPFALQKQAQQQEQQAAASQKQIQQAGAGAGAAGAVGGAAAGALIGGISGHSAEAAAGYGAAAGFLIARRRARKKKEEASEQATQQSQQATQATQAQMGDFKKAFSVCLKAKNYMVEY